MLFYKTLLVFSDKPFVHPNPESAALADDEKLYQIFFFFLNQFGQRNSHIAVCQQLKVKLSAPGNVGFPSGLFAANNQKITKIKALLTKLAFLFIASALELESP